MLNHKVNTLFFAFVIFGLITLSVFMSVAWWMFLVPVILWVFITGIGSAFIRFNYHLKALCSQKNPDGKQIAITFDDGPTPETEKVLALLKQHDAKATFFCIGRQIDKYPEILKKVIEEGHTIGNHTYNHASDIGLYSRKKMIEEIISTDTAILEVAAKKARLFRPPYGVTNPNISNAVRHTGHNVIGWNIRSLDAVLTDEEHILNRIKNRLAPGSIILLHDTSQKTVNVLEQLLVFLKQNKYQMVTIDRLLNIKAYEE